VPFPVLAAAALLHMRAPNNIVRSEIACRSTISTDRKTNKTFTMPADAGIIAYLSLGGVWISS
jgi:hypothetical protein